MGCIALVPCVLVLPCGLAGVVWYPYACFSWSLFNYKTRICALSWSFARNNLLSVWVPTDCRQQGVLFQNFYVLPVIAYSCFVYDI